MKIGKILLTILFMVLISNIALADGSVVAEEIVVMELFKMSKCPFCADLEETLEELVYDFDGRFVVKPYFVMYEGEGANCFEGFCSLHGETEIMLNIVEGSVYEAFGQEVYFDLVDYINEECWNVVTEDDLVECLEDGPIDIDDIEDAIDDFGEDFLEDNFETVNEYGVSGTPTMYINDNLYAESRDYEDLKEEICGRFTDKPKICEEVVEVVEEEYDIMGIMEEGETRTYTINSFEYEISVYDIDDDEAEIIINGEGTFVEDGVCVKYYGVVLCVEDILYDEEIRAVEFGINSREEARELGQMLENAIEEMENIDRLKDADMCLVVPYEDDLTLYYDVGVWNGYVWTDDALTPYCDGHLYEDFIIQFESFEKFIEFIDEPTYYNFVNGEELGIFNFGISRYVDSDGMHFTEEFKEDYCGIIHANTNIMQRLLMGLSDCGDYAKEKVMETIEDRFDDIEWLEEEIKEETDPEEIEELEEEIEYVKERIQEEYQEILSKEGVGSVEFEELVDLRDLPENYEDYIKIEKGKITIDTEILPQLSNQRARITMEGLSFAMMPKVLMNGEECGDVCGVIMYEPATGTLQFEVEHFTTFEAAPNLPESYMRPYERTNKPRSEAKVDRINIPEEYVKGGEDLMTGVNVKNIGDFDIEQLKATIFIPELGVRRQSGHIDVDMEDEVTEWILAEIPEDVMPGDYDVRIVISNDHIKRVKHRVITVE